MQGFLAVSKKLKPEKAQGSANSEDRIPPDLRTIFGGIVVRILHHVHQVHDVCFS